MNLIVQNLGLSYETLAFQALKLNKSYLTLLELYQEINLTIDLFQELENSEHSPIRVIKTMFQEQTNIQLKFNDLAKLIANSQSQVVDISEIEALQAIAHDCQVMQNFVDSIDVKVLQQMFIQLSK